MFERATAKPLDRKASSSFRSWAMPPLSRPVTSLGHQGERRVFWERPIFLHYVQTVFPGGGNFLADFAPLVTALLLWCAKCAVPPDNVGSEIAILRTYLKIDIVYRSHSPFKAWNAPLFVCLHGLPNCMRLVRNKAKHLLGVEFS